MLVQTSQEENDPSIADSNHRQSMRGLVSDQNRRSLRSLRGLSLRALSLRSIGIGGDRDPTPAPEVSIEPMVCMPTAKHLQQWLERNVPNDDDATYNAIEWTLV